MIFIRESVLLIRSLLVERKLRAHYYTYVQSHCNREKGSALLLLRTCSEMESRTRQGSQLCERCLSEHHLVAGEREGTTPPAVALVRAREQVA